MIPRQPFFESFSANGLRNSAQLHHAGRAACRARFGTGHAWPAHDGPTLLADDSLNAAFNAQTDNAGTQTDVFEPDATAQTRFAMDEEEEGQVQPLFVFLDDHATDTSASMPLEGGDDALHNGYLGNEGENSGNSAGLHAPIALTLRR